MEVALLLLGLIFYARGWDMVGVTKARSTGIVGAAVGITLVALLALGKVEGAANQALVFLFALYALLVAAGGLWEHDLGTLGFYSLVFAVAALGFGVALLAGGKLLGFSLLLALVALALQFVQYGLAARGLQAVTGYVTLVVGIANLLIALLALGAVPGVRLLL